MIIYSSTPYTNGLMYMNFYVGRIAAAIVATGSGTLPPVATSTSTRNRIDRVTIFNLIAR